MNILCFDGKSITHFLDMHLKIFILNRQRNISKCQYPYTFSVVLQTEKCRKILSIAADIQFPRAIGKNHKKPRKRHCMRC